MSRNYSHSFVELCRAALDLCGTRREDRCSAGQGGRRAGRRRGFVDAATALAIAYQVTLPEMKATAGARA